MPSISPVAPVRPLPPRVVEPVADLNRDGITDTFERTQLQTQVETPTDPQLLEQYAQRAEALERSMRDDELDAESRLRDARAALTRLPEAPLEEVQRQLDAVPRDFDGKIDAKAAEVKALTDKRKNLPALIESMRGTVARHERLKDDPQALERARNNVAKVSKELEGLDAKLAAAKTELQSLKAQRDQSRAELARLGPQVNYLRAERAVQDEAAKRAALKQLRTQATEGAGQARRRDAQALDEVRGLTRKAQASSNQVDDPTFQEKVQTVRKAEAVRAAIDSGKLEAKDVNLTALARDQKGLGAELRAQADKVERDAAAVVKRLDSKEFQDTLSRASPAERAQVLGDAAQAISRSQVGRDHLNRTLVPVLEGLPTGSTPWKQVFSGADKTATGVDGALTVLEKAGKFLASRRGGENLIDAGLAKALALAPGQLEVVRDAVALANKNPAAALKLLDESKLGRLSGALSTVGKSVTALSAVAAVGELIREPTVQSALLAGKGAGELTELLAGFAKNGSRLAKVGAMLGDVAPILTMASGALGISEAAGRGDTGGVVGNSLVAAGGLIAMWGLGASATGVGTVAGVPLAVIGGVVSGVGAAVDLFFGDSDTEKWLKTHAPEYLAR